MMRFSCICVSLQLGEATIHQAHSLEPTIWFECPCKSFVLFSLAMAFQLLLLHANSGNGTSFHIFLAMIDKTINLPVFLVASVIFGFCIISYAEL